MPSTPSFGALPTEKANPASRGIDARPIEGILAVIAAEDARVSRAVWKGRRALARASVLLARSWESGGRWVFAGAGTSGRLGVIEAAELPPTFGVPASRVRALMAGGPRAVFRAVEGAEDDPKAGARAAAANLRRGDALVAIAASGVTPFVRGAIASARRARARTVLITANPRAAAGAAEVVVALPVGPEVVAGSTRLKAGTAAKMALNALTTAAMIRLGKVYEGRMVDLQPASQKLRARSLRIVAELGGVPESAASELLANARGSVKTAVLMARRSLSREKAESRLAACGGNLRAALKEGRA